MLMIEELKERIIERVDPDLFVELLDITTAQLCEVFHDRVEEKRNVFIDLEIEENNEEQ